MRHFLSALILALIALALTLSVDRPASAMQHNYTAASGAAALCDTDPDGDCQHRDCHDGRCIHACCSAAGMASLAPANSIPRTAFFADFGFPVDCWRDGITIRPVLAPPKLSI